MFYLDRLIPMALLVLGCMLFAAGTAFAGPAAIKVHSGHHGGHHVAKRAYGHGHGHVHGHSHTAKHGNVCRTIYTFGRRGSVKQVICDGVSNRHDRPPAWAPAHGRRHVQQYRHHRGHKKHRSKRHYRPVLLEHQNTGWPINLEPIGQVVAPATRQVTDGRYCREYTRTATIDGRPQQIYGHACLQPDGNWQIIDFVP